MALRGNRPSTSLSLVALLLAGGAFTVWFRHRPSAPALPPSLAEDYRPPGAPDRPHLEVSPASGNTRVHHKDGRGRSPLELVQTPEGVVTIQRTFSESGALLKEAAFLEGRPVPVPNLKR